MCGKQETTPTNNFVSLLGQVGTHPAGYHFRASTAWTLRGSRHHRTHVLDIDNIVSSLVGGGGAVRGIVQGYAYGFHPATDVAIIVSSVRQEGRCQLAPAKLQERFVQVKRGQVEPERCRSKRTLQA